MQQDRGIDWYSISKLNNDSFSLQAFSEIIAKVQPSQGIDRVTQHYRRKLLILFQNAYQKIKEQTPELMIDNGDLQIKKSIVLDHLQNAEKEVEESYQQISNMRMVVAEKKRLLMKLRQRLQKKAKLMTQKVYCCAVCDLQNFQSPQALKLHMQKYHNEILLNKSDTSNQVTQLKDLLMTMKDKQIEMMSMFLKANRQLQTQKLEREYVSQYKKYMNVSAAKTEESKQEDQLVQLKGESQFLFFQKSEQFRRQMEKDIEFRRKFKEDKTVRENSLKNQSYNPGNYYNIFGSIPQNTSLHLDKSPTKRDKSDQKQVKVYGYYDPPQFISKVLHKNHNLSSDSRFTLLQHSPRPYIEGKFLGKESRYAAPSISDRLKQNTHNKEKPVETIYSTKRKFYDEKGYVFNSGPLMDDKGEGSDYQDYFGDNKNLNVSIQDEEIKMNHNHGHNISHYQSNKDSLYLSKLLSPQNQSITSNSMLQKSVKDKSSVIVDLSDSFSKRDFQISKDDETINLSDLKLSKLEKKKDQVKKMKNQQSQKQQVSVLPYNSGSNWKKPEIQKVGPTAELERQSLTRVLKEFQRRTVAPLVEQNMKFGSSGSSLNSFFKPSDRTNVLDASSSQKLLASNKLGILNDFLREEFKPQQVSYLPKGTQQLDKFVLK